MSTEPTAAPFKILNKRDEVLEASTKAIQSPDNHRVARTELIEHPIQLRATIKCPRRSI